MGEIVFIFEEIVKNSMCTAMNESPIRQWFLKRVKTPLQIYGTTFLTTRFQLEFETKESSILLEDVLLGNLSVKDLFKEKKDDEFA